jgi:hypothetical protein
MAASRPTTAALVSSPLVKRQRVRRRRIGTSLGSRGFSICGVFNESAKAMLAMAFT